MLLLSPTRISTGEESKMVPKWVFLHEGTLLSLAHSQKVNFIATSHSSCVIPAPVTDATSNTFPLSRIIFACKLLLDYSRKLILN